MENNKLAARVKALNKANEIANEIFPKLQSIFKPYIGQKIIKGDGTLLAKIVEKVVILPNTGTLRITRPRNDYTLRWAVSVCEHFCETTVVYEEAQVYVGDVSGGILERLAVDSLNLRTDYTVEEVEQKRETYREAKKVADTAFSALCPFDEFDR